jgi:subtilisin family serine protease
MKPHAILALLVLVLLPVTPAAGDATWICFTDKALDSPQAESAALASAAARLSPAALERRSRRGTTDSLVTLEDIPVADAYIRAVESTGVKVRQTSRWLNAISVDATPDQLAAIGGLPFVGRTRPVARSATPAAVAASPLADAPLSPAAPQAPLGFYGNAGGQLSQINLVALHNAGYTGAGVTVGVLDTGFKRTHEAFNYAGHPVNVLDEWDFVEDDGDTSDTTSGQHTHGTYILGVVGAYYPNRLVGGAYDASFLLAKTEDVTREVQAEEDDWVAGLEWLEQEGADLVTSSLGYINWYSQSQLDGETAECTIAADAAAARGLPIINAAGNEGHDSDPATSHLIAPADGDLVIAVGAVSSTGSIASFSSDGPSADGRVKPEVLARGVSTATVNPNDNDGYSWVNGTSLSTPLVASAAACLLQAHPDWTVPELREALFMTAAGGGTFDPLYVRGYGAIDAAAAANYEFADPVPEPTGAVFVLLTLAGVIARRSARTRRS